MDHSSLTQSKTYIEETDLDIRERRELACELLKKDASLTRRQLVELMAAKGIAVGLSTLANDVAAMTAAENFLSGKLTLEEVRNEQRPYRKFIYSGVRCLIKDGFGPGGLIPAQEIEEVGPVQKNKEVVIPANEEVFMLLHEEDAEPQSVPDFSAAASSTEQRPEGLLERRQEFYREIEVLIIENQILNGQLQQTKQSLEEETALRVKLQTRTENVKKAFAAYIQKTRAGSLYQLINRQGHENVTLKERVQQLEQQLGVSRADASCLAEALELSKANVVSLNEAVKSLRDDLAFKELELEEKLLEIAKPDDIAIEAHSQPAQVLEVRPEQDATMKEEYVFPAHCFNPDIPMRRSDDFMDYYNKLPDEIKSSTMKAINLIATSGLYHPSLQTKKRRDGRKQFHVSMKYRVFYDIINSELVILSVLHKNAI